MSEEHPDRGTLQRFLLGELAPADSRVVVGHLVGGCPACKEATSKLWGAATVPAVAVRPGSWRSAPEITHYDDAIGRALEMASKAYPHAEAERSQALELCDRLNRHPLPRRLLLVRNSQRFATWGVCDHLLSRAWGHRFEEPRCAADLAEVAVAVAENLPSERYSASLVEDLRAQAWATLGHTRRILSDFQGAESAFSVAHRHLAAGTGSPLVRATVLDFEASLRSDQHRYEEADHLASEAIRLYHSVGDRHLIGRTLIKKAMVRGYLNDYDGEIVLVREGLDLVDAQVEPQLVIAAWHNLIQSLHERGENRQALALLARARSLYLKAAGRTSLIRFQWLEGNVAAALGRLDQAEGCLREARRAFIEAGIAVDAALVALDLAGVLARQRRHAEVRELAAEMVAIFRSRQIHTELLAALLLFQQAAEKERVTAVLIEKVAEQLRQGRERLEPRQGA